MEAGSAAARRSSTWGGSTPGGKAPARPVLSAARNSLIDPEGSIEIQPIGRVAARAVSGAAASAARRVLRCMVRRSPAILVDNLGERRPLDRAELAHRIADRKDGVGMHA